MIKGRKVYDQLTDTWITGYLVADDKVDYYPVCQKGAGMERLTDKNAVGNYFYPKCFEKCDGFGASSKCDNCEIMTSVCEKLDKYEDLEEQGRLVKLPCKIGDKVWHISGRDIKEDVISGIEYSYDGMFYIWSNEDTWLGGFNDIVFLTKSEAEAKLRELRGGENE